MVTYHSKIWSRRGTEATPSTGEHVVGLNCIASAMYDDAGSVVAIISGPASG
ncbi:hypothetical protein KCP74_23985 [Salmonella enterica subsp. enterica]|nr:hypothetical protein KCP74_23985 [Salmonella enterica subsp. enterica]